MNRKSIFKSLCLTLTMIVIFVSLSPIEAATQINEFERQMQRQEIALQIYSLFEGSLDSDNNGKVIYPDSFAGTWIDDETLVIAITSFDDLPFYKLILGDENRFLRYQLSDYSYNELYAAGEAIYSQVYKELGPIITELYVSHIDNMIVVGLQPSSYLELNEYICSLTSYPIVVQSIEASETTATSLKSGHVLWNTNRSQGYSLAACGIYNGSDVIVTCGHDFQQNGDNMTYGSGTATIGTVTHHNYSISCDGDFEFVYITNTSAYTKSSSHMSGYSFVGSLSDPPTNTLLKYYGGYSSYVSYGYVNAQNLIIQHTGTGYYVHGLSQIKLSYGTCLDGDSGSAIYRQMSNGIQLAGILSSRSSSNGYMYVSFTPYSYLSAAGFSLYTN